MTHTEKLREAAEAVVKAAIWDRDNGKHGCSISVALRIPDLVAALALPVSEEGKDEKIARLQERLDRTLTAALRYESRHDLDPERGKLWGELKMALMVDAPEFLALRSAVGPSPALPTDEKPECFTPCDSCQRKWSECDRLMVEKSEQCCRDCVHQGNVPPAPTEPKKGSL